MLAGTHVGIGHARHGQVRERFAAAVAGGRNAHQARVVAVLHVTHQHAVFDQRGALAGRAFVVDIERAATAVQGAVIDDGHARRGHALADAPGVDAGALAVEVAFQAVAHRLVQQHAGPARAEHYRHHPGRRRDRIQIHQRLAQRFAREAFRAAVGEQVGIAIAPAAAGITGFAPAALFDDHLHVQAHQRAHVRCQHAIAAGDQHRVHAAGQAHHHLLDARVGSAQELVDPAQQVHLGGAVHVVDRVGGRVQRTATAAHQRAGGLRAALARDRARGLRCFEQGIAMDIVGIGEAGFLAGDCAHAHALLDGVRTVLDDAVFHAPALAPRMLEIQIAEVDARAQQGAEGAVEMAGVQAGGKQQPGFGQSESVIGHAVRMGPGRRGDKSFG